MKPSQYGPQQIVLASSTGDVFWDLPPYITYIAGAQIGATIYVANPSDEDRQYALLTKLFDAAGTPLIEESIVVYGYTWFPVKAGELIKLHAEMAFEFSNAILTVVLVEKDSDDEVDSVSTYLVAPTAAQLPPGFPGAVSTAGFDWTSLMMMMMFIPLVGMIAGAYKEEEKKPEALPPAERPQLPLGRG